MKATYILNNSIYTVIQCNSTHHFKFPYFDTLHFFPERSHVKQVFKSSSFYTFYLTHNFHP